MRHYYTGRTSVPRYAFLDHQMSRNRDLVVRELCYKFVNSIKDKFDPVEIDSNYDYITYEQTLYIFTPQELKEYVKQEIIKLAEKV